MGVCGWLLDFMLKSLLWDSIRAYRVVFFVYAGLGVVMICIVLSLSKECEIVKLPVDDLETSSTEGGKSPKGSFILSNIPTFSRRSKFVVAKICALFALESFGSNLAPLYVTQPSNTCYLLIDLLRSWITFFFHDKFGLPESKIGSLFFITTIVAAVSMLFAAALARRFGNVKVSISLERIKIHKLTQIDYGIRTSALSSLPFVDSSPTIGQGVHRLSHSSILHTVNGYPTSIRIPGRYR